MLLRSLFRAKDVNVRFCITQVLSRDSFFEATQVSTTTLTTKSFVYRWLLHTCILQGYEMHSLTDFDVYKTHLIVYYTYVKIKYCELNDNHFVERF